MTDRRMSISWVQDYHILQNYAAKIDVLTIPFLINEITKATSPVKLFEYMALNKRSSQLTWMSAESISQS